MIKAQYSAAEAQVKIGEAATGIGEQMADTGLAIQRAKDKTEQMQARASAIDELTEAGALEDFTSPDTQLDRELAQLLDLVAGRRGARQAEGRARRRPGGTGDRRSRPRDASRTTPRGERTMIVRLMGEGQFRLPDELSTELHELDTEAVAAVEASDGPRLQGLLESMGRLVSDRGERLHDAHLAASDLIIPPTDLTLDEARELYVGEGLIPDLPS